MPAPTLLAKSQQVATSDSDSTLTKAGHAPAVGTTYLLVAVGWNTNSTRSITSVTYGGVGMTRLAGIDDTTGGSTFCGVAFYGLASPGSSGDIVLTASNSCDGMVIWALDLKDVNTSSPVATSNTSAASGTAAKSLSMTTSGATLMFGMRCVNRVTSTYTPGTGVTEEYDIQHGPGGIGTYFLGRRNSSGAETFSFGCTIGATANGDAMAVIAIAGTLNQFTMAANQGSYSLTGQAVALKFGRRIGADQGSYSLSGQDVALKPGRRIAADQGSYTLVGQAVDLLYDDMPRLIADPGFYALGGQNVTLYYDGTTYKLLCETGSYVLTGQDVDFFIAHLLLPAGLRSCWSPRNALRQATVAASSEAGDLPVGNAIEDPHGGTVWRALSDLVTVDATWQASVALRAFALAFTTLSEAAHIRLSLSAIETGGSDLLDTGWMPADVQRGFDQWVLVLQQSIPTRFLRIEIRDSRAPGFIDTGFLWAGDAFETTLNPVKGVALGADDPTIERMSRGGASYVVPRRPTRLVRGLYDFLPEDQAMGELLDLARRGTADNVLFVPNPSLPERNRESVLGLLQKQQRVAENVFGRRSWGFEIRERL